MLTKYLIICPLVFIAGFIDAVAGGGGLVSLPAYMLTGLPVHNCIATNKMSSIMGTSVATTKYAINGYIPWRIAPFCIPCALIGSSIGAEIALMIPERAFKIIMLFVVPLTAIYVLTKKDLFVQREEQGINRRVIILCASIAFTVGCYDGFYGPGTGTFLILLITGLAGLELTKANGLAKIINFSTNLAALTVFFFNDQVLIPLGLVAGAFNIAGNYLGATRFEKSEAAIVKPVIIIVLIIFLLKLIIELL